MASKSTVPDLGGSRLGSARPSCGRIPRTRLDGQRVRQYLDGLRTNTTAVTATGGWSIYKWGWQFFGSQALDEAYVPLFGAFGAAWDDAMVARWSADPLGMLWPEMDATFVTSGGGNGSSPGAIRRPVVIIAAG